MKRILAALCACGTLVGSVSARAADSDVTVVTAIVPVVCDLSSPASAVLDLNAASTIIGNLDIACNDPNGSGFSISSANSGNLVGPNGSKIGYGLQLPFDASPRSLAGVSNVQTAPGMLFNQAWQIRLVPNGQNEGPRFGGTYTDTVTFEIVGN